jgi:pantoate kinase
MCLRIEEDGMQQILGQLAAERIADLNRRAEAARLVREARRQAPATGLRKLARRVAAAIAEDRAAQRRVTVLAVSTEQQQPRPSKAPDTYDEFLARTAGPLLSEPPAAKRLTGKSVR